jgi:lactoylglutathione lyase
MTRRSQLVVFGTAVLVATVAVARFSPVAVTGAEIEPRAVTAKAVAASEFAKSTIDLGMCVSDIEKSVKFYTEAVGFTENPGFGVPGPFSADAGLTDGAALDIKVLTLGSDETATKLKLMQIKGTKKAAATGANEFVHSQHGFRYLTIYVNDMTASVARLEKAGVKPIGKTPIAIPKEIAEGMFLTIMRDPDGNMVELVGPKK